MESGDSGSVIFTVAPTSDLDTACSSPESEQGPEKVLSDTHGTCSPSDSENELHTGVRNGAVSPEIPPILQGHVFKRSTSGVGSKLGLSSFKKRYFVLCEGVLLYYEHQSSYERDRQHNLKHGKRIHLDGLYLTHSTGHTAHHSFTLHVPHKDNRRKAYLLAMRDRKSKNIWIEMLQQQNPQLQPSVSETDGHIRSIPSYINMIRTMPTPSPILRAKSLPQQQHQVHISQLENYHYSAHCETRRKTWSTSRGSAPGLLMSNVSRPESSLSVSRSVSNSSTGRGSVHSLSSTSS